MECASPQAMESTGIYPPVFQIMMWMEYHVKVSMCGDLFMVFFHAKVVILIVLIPVTI